MLKKQLQFYCQNRRNKLKEMAMYICTYVKEKTKTGKNPKENVWGQ